MKKTLITLLAAASCTMGATLEDAVVSMTGSNVATTTDLSSLNLDGSFSLVLTMNMNSVESFLSGAVRNQSYTVASVSTTNSQKAGVCFVFSKDYEVQTDSNGEKGLVTIASTTDSVSSTIGTPGWTRGHVDATGIEWDKVAGVTITMVHTDKTKTENYLTVVDTAGNKTIYTTSNTNLQWSGGFNGISALNLSTDYVTGAYFFDSALSASDVGSISKALTVPEPTTATLSLLALCGLAARRRRK